MERTPVPPSKRTYYSKREASFRKNSKFVGNEHGGERVALFYSLVESCKLNNIDPFAYLQDVYERIHDCPACELINLLPPYWKKSS